MKRHWVTKEEEERIWQLYLRNKAYYKSKMKLYTDIGKLLGHKWQAIATRILKKEKSQQANVIKNQLKLF